MVDFRLKCMTFDNVPWICTMKKNEHYFPTTEWVKDAREECGWRRVTHEHGRKVLGMGSEGLDTVVAGSVCEDEGGEVGAEPVEPSAV